MASSSSLGAQDECDISEVSKVWDSIPQVRARLRSGQTLFPEASDKNQDLRTPSQNVDLMRPLIQKMADHAKKLPSINALREEVRAVHLMNHREVDAVTVEGPSWSLRKYCGYVKMKARKRDPSTESC